MNRHPRIAKLLPAFCAGLLLTLALTLILPAMIAGPSGAPPTPQRTGAGLSPFVAQGGNIAQACNDVATCTTGAITNVDAGDTLVVIVTELTTSAGAPSTVEEVTSGGDNALALLGSTPCVSGSGHGVTAIYGLADVVAEASVTFTVTYAGAEYYTIHALDVEGVAASPFETAGAGVCSTAAGTTAKATVTTTVVDDLVILGVEVRATTGIFATGGDNLVNNATTVETNPDSGAMLDEIDPTTGSISLSATITSASWSAIAVALKSAPLVSGVVSPANSTIDAGQTIGLSTTDATGGTPSISYQWYSAISNTACTTGTLITGATAQSYTPPALAVGTYFYCVWATDSSTPTHQVVYSNVANITVNPALSVTISPNAPTINSGQTEALTAHPLGGTGIDTYAWYSGSSCSGSMISTAKVYTTPALKATSEYCVAATDSASSPATATATATVAVSATPLSVTITPTTPAVDSGKTIQLTAHPSGGTGTDTYAWYAGNSCTGTVLATTQVLTTPALTAATSYCVAATDSAFSPVTATASATVTILPGSTSTSTLPPFVYPAIGAVVALLAALLLLALLARRGRKMTFNQVGLPPETEWSLSFAGMAQKSMAPSITFSAKRGRHEYAVTDLSGYTAVPPSGVVEVGKDPANLKITFMAKATQPPLSEPTGPAPSSEPVAGGPADAAQPPEAAASEPSSPAHPAESDSSDPASPVSPSESGAMDPTGPAA
jgi:hypothetical protein